MRILVTYAVQGEFTELKFPGLIGEEEVQVGYLRTGVGKVKSAFYLSEAISHAQPDLVVNVGTAGTIRHRVGDIFVCRHFVDRDMQKLVELGMEYEIDSMDLSSQCFTEFCPIISVTYFTEMKGTFLARHTKAWA